MLQFSRARCVFRINSKEKRKEAIDGKRFRAKESLRDLRAIST